MYRLEKVKAIYKLEVILASCISTSSSCLEVDFGEKWQPPSITPLGVMMLTVQVASHHR